MAKQTIAYMRLSGADSVLEVGLPVGADGIAVLNVEPIFLGTPSHRIASLSIKPFLDAPADARKRELRELVFKARIVCGKNVVFPFPDALLR
jgi:hypothetical protein